MSSSDSQPPKVAVPNGVPPPVFDLPLPNKPEIITANLLKLNEQAKDERLRFIFKNLVTHLHSFVTETDITTEEWMGTIQFLTRVGQTCTPLRQEFILLSDVLGVSALVDAHNNPPIAGATESSVLGPFYTEDAHHFELGESIASEGKGEYLYVRGRVLSTDGTPISNATIETWETDANGYYDTQYAGRTEPDCRGKVSTDKDGNYRFRAVVPVAYPIPGDGPVGELLLKLHRHNMRPNHLHLMVEAPGYRTLTTAVYPEGDKWLTSDAVFGVKESLGVKYQTVHDDAQARALGFAKGGPFKLLEYDMVLINDEDYVKARAQVSKANTKVSRA